MSFKFLNTVIYGLQTNIGIVALIDKCVIVFADTVVVVDVVSAVVALWHQIKIVPTHFTLNDHSDLDHDSSSTFLQLYAECF